MQNMTREDLLEKVVLERLGQKETSKVINSALGTTDLDEEFLNRVYKETGGTPFFVLEVIKMLIQEGFIKNDEEGIWTLTERELCNTTLDDLSECSS